MLLEDCKALMHMSLYASVPVWMKELPDHFKTQQMCNKTMCITLDAIQNPKKYTKVIKQSLSPGKHSWQAQNP